MVKSTFSNGFVDTYKGSRDVKSGWAVIEIATGAVVKSGHSLDREKAAKTAQANVPRACSLDRWSLEYLRKKHFNKTGRWVHISWFKRKQQEKNVAEAAKYRIEVVEVA